MNPFAAMVRNLKYGATVLVLLLIAGSGQAEERVTFADEKVSIAIPEGFVRMSEDLVKRKYPNGIPPQYVFANENTTVSIAAGYTPNANLTVEQLPQFKEFLENTFERMTPGIKWITRGFVEINGNKWIHLEFQSNAIDTEIRNTVLATAVDKGVAMLNFNATVGEYGTSRLALEKSQRSIEIMH